MNARDTSGILAALALSATLALLLARFLPIEFAYVENTLGIVSIATEERYPQQKETFWLLFSGGLVVILTGLLAPALGTNRPERRPFVEALAALSLLGALWLPTPAGLGLAVAASTGAALLARGRTDVSPAAGLPSVAGGRRPVGSRGAIALACLALALLLTPSFWTSAVHVAIGLPDDRRTVDAFTFQGELGQHLAWANALAHGRFHGKDFFCLYGPLFDLGGVGAWRIFGRSIVAWELYFAMTRVLGLAALLLLGAALLRRRAWLLLIPFLVPWVNLRTGWACFGLVLVHGWLRSLPARDAGASGGQAAAGRPGWMGAAGAIGGVSILYSQEFGLAFAVTAAAVLLLHRAWRATLLFGAGFAAVVSPVLVWYAAHDALVPMLVDLTGYPGYIVAGYAKLAFPNLAAAIPLDPAAFGTRALLPYQLGYGIPAVVLGSFLLVLPATGLRVGSPLAGLRRTLEALRADPERTLLLATAFFGLLSFRSALGRSDVVHMIAALPAAAVLLAVACDRTWGLWRVRPRGTPESMLALWRSLAVLLLIAHVGFTLAPRPIVHARESLASLLEPTRGAARAIGDPTTNRVARWIREHTEPEDPVLFLPNDGAYYYLTDRPNPIRFVMGHQMVTEAHRRESLERLRATPPAYVVWDGGALRVDGLADEKVLGAELLAWIRDHYERERRIGRVDILRPRGHGSG